MILASILITSDGKIPSPLPRIVGENIASLKRNHEDLEHILFDDAMIRDFLSANFDNKVLAAYDDLVPYAYKADLARYCILYKLGGVYSDVSLFIMSAFPPVDGKLGAFRDLGVGSPWEVTNAIIASPPGHKTLKKSIEMVCDNVRRRYYGPSAIAPTGPTLFGKAIALTCEPEEVNIGECFRPPHGGNSARCLIDTNADKLVAVSRKSIAGSLEELGISNGNSYGDLWHAQNIYASDRDRPKVWNAPWLHRRHFTKGRLDGDVLAIEGADGGTIVWGPYVHLAPGAYSASIVLTGGRPDGEFSMDIAAAKGTRIIADARMPTGPKRAPFRLSFDLLEETPAIEVRLHAGGSHRIAVKEVQLEKRGP